MEIEDTFVIGEGRHRQKTKGTFILVTSKLKLDLGAYAFITSSIVTNLPCSMEACAATPMATETNPSCRSTAGVFIPFVLIAVKNCKCSK